jgi:hypothetical protein
MKKIYSSPRLTEYGSVNELTNLFGNPTVPDLALKLSDPATVPANHSSSDGILAP